MILSKRILSLLVMVLIMLISLTHVRKAITLTEAFIHDYIKGSDYKLTDYIRAINNTYGQILSIEKGFSITNRGEYINFNGLMAALMGQRTLNGVVKLNNGGLALLVKKTDHDIDQIQKLSDIQHQRGGELLLVSAPTAVWPYEDLVPTGYVDYRDENTDSLHAALEKAGVRAYDLRQEAYEEGFHISELISKTDTHWYPTAAFWGYTKIIRLLIQGTPFEDNQQIMQALDINNFDVRNYNEIYIGNLGARVGRSYAGFSDWQTIVPKFETQLTMIANAERNPSRRTGNFRQVIYRAFIDESYVVNKYAHSSFEHYNGYWGNDYYSIHNEHAPIPSRVCVIGDSYTSSCVSYMPLIFKDIDWFMTPTIDKCDFEKYYIENQPDIIIVLRSSFTGNGVWFTNDYLPSYVKER